MKLFHYIITAIGTAVGGLLLAGCAADTPTAPESSFLDGDRLMELTIRVPAGNLSTRSNPHGGDNGDGRENGVNFEDKIYNINLFFYSDAEGKGLDGDKDTHLYGIYKDISNYVQMEGEYVVNLAEEYKWERKEDKEKNEYVYTLTFPYKEEDFEQFDKQKTYFIPIVNTGNLTGVISTLGQLRDYEPTRTWTESPSGIAYYNQFVMSQAYNDASQGYINFDVEQTEKQFFRGSTTVERLCSRLDVWYKDGKNNLGAGELNYEVKVDKNDGEIKTSDVYITHIQPVNVMSKSSWMFKRVTKAPHVWDFTTLSPLNGTMSKADFADYLATAGRETPLTISTADLPTNYVVEPRTIQKRVLSGRTANERRSMLEGWYGATASHKIVGNYTTLFGSGSKCGVTSYPATDAPQGEFDANTGCDKALIVGYANENTQAMADFNSNYITGMVFRVIYVPENVLRCDAEGNCTNVAAPSELSAGAAIYRLSATHQEQDETLSLYFADEASRSNYKKTHPGEVWVERDYVAALHGGKYGFVCYYNLWLRHYNDESKDPGETYPMEYATVRNNIYRVALSFTGPGDPEPTMREPDTMRARIFVRKWNKRSEEKAFEFD